MGTIILATALAFSLILLERYWIGVKRTRRSKNLLFKGLLY